MSAYRRLAAIPRKVMGNHSNVFSEVLPSFAFIGGFMAAGMLMVGGLQNLKQKLIGAVRSLFVFPFLPLSLFSLRRFFPLLFWAGFVFAVLPLRFC
jgi:hypothetical protein